MRDTPVYPEDQSIGKSRPGSFEKRPRPGTLVETVLYSPRLEGAAGHHLACGVDAVRCLGLATRELIKSVQRVQCDPPSWGVPHGFGAGLDDGFPQRLLVPIPWLGMARAQEGGCADALQPLR